MNRWAKGILVAGIMALALTGMWWRYSEFLSRGMKPSTGTLKLEELEQGLVPEVEMEALDGRKVHLADLKDKVVILSFWASWCDPCVAEFPSMIKLADFFKGKVVLLAVSADYAKEDIESFIKPLGPLADSVYILWDKERKIAEKFGTEVLPESYVFGHGLKAIRKVAGAENWFAPGAVELFQRLVDGAAVK